MIHKGWGKREKKERRHLEWRVLEREMMDKGRKREREPRRQEKKMEKEESRSHVEAERDGTQKEKRRQIRGGYRKGRERELLTVA